VPWSPRILVALFTAGTALLHPPPTDAQSAAGGAGGRITGRVTDALTRQGVADVAVQITGTRLGATTDQDGRYRITNAPLGVDTIVVRRLGYVVVRQAVTVSADQPATADLALQPAAMSLDQVVVTGTPGTQQRREIGNSVSTIDATEQLSKSQAPELGDLLTSRAPGVDIAPSTGRLGAGPNIEIRGVSSLGLSNTPLLYIDGVRVSNHVGGGPTSNADNGFGSQNAGVVGRLNDISPDEIESIQIIKGPAAATIYGTEAANGVIQIITKKGAGTQPRWNLHLENGAIYFRDPEGRLPTNYAMDSTHTVVPFNAVRAMDAAGTPIFKNGQARHYDGEVSGGFEHATYYVSSAYQNDLGIEPNNSIRQFSGHANLNLTASPQLDVATSLNYVQGMYHLGVDVGLSSMLGAEFAHPLVFSVPGADGFYPNVPPQVPQTLFDNSDGITRFTGSVTLTNRPASWLTQRVIVGLDNTGEDGRTLERFAPPALAPFTLGDPTGRIGQTLTNTTVTSADYTATARAALSSAWTASTSLGGQFYRTEINQSFLGGIGFPAPAVTTVSGTAIALPSTQADTVNTTIGGYGQEEFGFKDRLFLTGAVRVDNNSAFGNQFKLIAYPKASAAWVISDEPFWHVSFIDQLKLRAAFGESGRAPLAFTALRTYVPVQGPGGTNAFTPGSFGNPNLKPELGKEIEGGFEGEMFGRLTLDFTYYNKHTTNELVAQNVGPSSGFFGTQFQNLGQVNNDGIELQATLQVLRKPNVAWDVSGMVSTAHNTVISLGGLPSLVTAFTQANVVGYPVESYFSRKVVSATVDPATGAVSNVLCSGGAGKAPVDCSIAPFLYAGSPTPTSIGSIGNTVTLFKRLRLYALVDWKSGNRLFNFVEQARCTGIIGAGLCNVDYHPQHYAPQYVAESTPLAFAEQAGDQFVQNASFVKFREVSATYSLPDHWLRGLQHLSVTIAARELALWSSYRGPDPEVNLNPTGLMAQDQGVIPPLSRVTATINIGF